MSLLYGAHLRDFAIAMINVLKYHRSSSRFCHSDDKCFEISRILNLQMNVLFLIPRHTSIAPVSTSLNP